MTANIIPTNPYAKMVDASNRATWTTTCHDAAGLARQDAAIRQAKAAELRVQAANLQTREGMRGAAEGLMIEAARLDSDAEDRLKMATAFDDMAAH